MSVRAVRTIVAGALLALLLPLSGCDVMDAAGPEASPLDPLAGAVVGDNTSFEGRIAVVDLERSAIVFSTGVRVEVGMDTEIHATYEIPDLETAAAWLAEGYELSGWGDGVVSSEDPPVIDASSLTMKRGALPEEGEDGEHEPHVVEFEGVVAAVNVDAGTLSLANGATIRVVDGTEISDDFGVPGLAAAREHLEAGDTVVAWGHGRLESEDPVVIEAAALVMKVRGAAEPDGQEGEGQSGHTEYEGIIISVDVEAGTIGLDGGATIRVVDATSISDDFGVATLAAAREHLEAGDTLVAWGKGEIESEDPVVIAALTLAMKVRNAGDVDGGEGDSESAHVEYEGVVVAVHVEDGTVSLDGGAIIRVVAETQISDDFGIQSLAAAHEALEGGAELVAWGKGEVESEDPPVIVAITLVMKAK